MTILKKIVSLIILIAICYGIIQQESQRQAFEQKYQDSIKSFEVFARTNATYQDASIFQKLALRRELLPVIAKLSQTGWSDQSIQKAFLKRLPQDHLDKAKITQKLQDSQIVGTQSFRQLWQAELFKAPKPHQLESNSQRLLNLLLANINIPKELNDTKKETDSLLRHFDQELSPTDPFWDELAYLVQTGFPTDKLIQDSQLTRQVHQLRYLISYQQTQWVRRHYQNAKETDAQALAKYLATLPEESYSLNESARYHNKLGQTFSTNTLTPVYPNGKPDGNFKVLIGFHSEFILSAEGNFLNALEEDNPSRSGIINCASFNYANSNSPMHIALDINPIFHDPDFMMQALKKGTITFTEPTMEQYKDKHDPIFSIKGKSARKASKALIKPFEKLIQSYRR